MKIISYRSTMPFNNRSTPGGDASISPSTQKGTVPFNNVFTIQDVLDGRTYDSLHGGGSWSPGKDMPSSYKEKGEDYKRRDRDMAIISGLMNAEVVAPEKWYLRLPGGYREFPTFGMAQKYKEKLLSKGYPNLSLTRKVHVAQSQNGQSRAQTVAQSINKTLMVESINLEAGVKETGSAFCVAPNMFVTCAHVVKKYDKTKPLDSEGFADKITLNLVRNGQRVKAKLVNVDLAWDIALLQADVDTDPFELEKSVDLGEDIIAIGSPHGYENNVSTGSLGSENKQIFFHENAPQYMFADLSVFPGNSGGPVIKESNGKVVGMITMIVSSEGTYGLNAALPANYIEDFLRRK